MHAIRVECRASDRSKKEVMCLEGKEPLERGKEAPIHNTQLLCNAACVFTLVMLRNAALLANILYTFYILKLAFFDKHNSTLMLPHLSDLQDNGQVDCNSETYA